LVALGCQQERTVTIGAVLPLTGQGSVYGQPVKKSVELAFQNLQASADYPFPLALDSVDPEK